MKRWQTQFLEKLYLNPSCPLITLGATIKDLLRMKTFVKNFFDKLSKIPSHYCRKHTGKSIIEPLFNSLAELHREHVSLSGDSQNSIRHQGIHWSVSWPQSSLQAYEGSVWHMTQQWQISLLWDIPQKKNIQYNLDFDDGWKDLPKPRGHDAANAGVPYHELLGICESKYKHLQELKSVIPKDYW